MLRLGAALGSRAAWEVPWGGSPCLKRREAAQFWPLGGPPRQGPHRASKPRQTPALKRGVHTGGTQRRWANKRRAKGSCRQPPTGPGGRAEDRVSERASLPPTLPRAHEVNGEQTSSKATSLQAPAVPGAPLAPGCRRGPSRRAGPHGTLWLEAAARSQPWRRPPTAPFPGRLPDSPHRHFCTVKG